MFTNTFQPSDMPEEEIQNEALNMISLFEYFPDLDDEAQELGFLYTLSSSDMLYTSAESDALTNENPTPISNVDETLSSADEFDENANNLSVTSLRNEAGNFPNADLPLDAPTHRRRAKPNLPGMSVIDTLKIKQYGAHYSKRLHF